MSTPELFKALHALQSECPPIQKTGRNTQQNYSFAGLDDWIGTLQPLLAKHGLALVLRYMDPEDLPTTATRSGGTMNNVRVRVCGDLFHAGSGGSISFSAFGQGSDTGDKAIYKAQTGARKYLLAAISGAATTDDAEREAKPQRPARGERPASVPTEKAAPWMVTTAQAQQLWTVFRTRCLEVEPDMGRDDIEAEGRRMLRDVLGIESMKQVPAQRFIEFGKLLQKWTLPDARALGADGSEDPDNY